MTVFGIFLVHIFPHLDWIRRDTLYLSVFGPNAGKYGAEKLRIWTLFAQWFSILFFHLLFIVSTIKEIHLEYVTKSIPGLLKVKFDTEKVVRRCSKIAVMKTFVKLLSSLKLSSAILWEMPIHEGRDRSHDIYYKYIINRYKYIINRFPIWKIINTDGWE